MLRNALVINVVVALAILGVLDLYEHAWRTGVAALLLAAANALLLLP